MKFVNTGSKHSPYESFENIKPDTDEGKPRYVPSYFETAKKQKSEKRHK